MGISRRSSLLAVTLAGALLAACGSQPTAEQAAPTQAAPTVAQAAPTQAAPTVAQADPTQAAPTVAQAAPTQAAPTVVPAAAAVASGPYADLPQSRTPEGYPVLGDPNAPVTLVMYSDFL